MICNKFSHRAHLTLILSLTLYHLSRKFISVLFLSSVDSAWKKGVLYGDGQNLARQLMEAPANHITPTVFANTIEQKLSPFAHRVTVHKR